MTMQCYGLQASKIMAMNDKVLYQDMKIEERMLARNHTNASKKCISVFI